MHNFGKKDSIFKWKEFCSSRVSYYFFQGQKFFLYQYVKILIKKIIFSEQEKLIFLKTEDETFITRVDDTKMSIEEVLKVQQVLKIELFS